MSVQMGGGNESDDPSKAKTSQALTPPDNNFLMIALQFQQDLQNQQQQQQQQQQNIANQAKHQNKLRPAPSFVDKQNMLLLQSAFNLLKKDQNNATGANQLNAICTPMFQPRENTPHAYKFTGPERKKLALKFLRKHKEELERALKEEKKLNKDAKKNASKLSIKGGGIEGMKDAVEVGHAMSGDPVSMGMVGAQVGMKIADKLLGGGGSSDKQAKPSSSKSPFALPSTKDKPTPLG